MMGVRNPALLSSFLLASFIYNTSADVKTICFIPTTLCVISLFTAVFPKCEPLVSGSFSKTQFSKQTHTRVSSIFKNKGYHFFFQGEYRREGRMLRIDCELISHGRSPPDCISKCAVKVNNGGRKDMGLKGMEGDSEKIPEKEQF